MPSGTKRFLISIVIIAALAFCLILAICTDANSKQVISSKSMSVTMDNDTLVVESKFEKSCGVPNWLGILVNTQVTNLRTEAHLARVGHSYRDQVGVYKRRSKRYGSI